ncbi:hypothetical protein PHYSODRAFT_327166 [Phytophthora sojae]|uniref:CCHC-type domain-containing protein n=1 Tax=Phytophthora sojae (strain P6497) TaxID=1094619 RepID=G4YYW0_PHYSP|nr:hypothetical protein PHYSODRAFT_327166 [Phytophthora sojae]EGZ26252.1 hypothetical protein PHYSODRAFT_327166 [Phytophthora sojae]|eukprot:XP_009521540.1 hypothetical protein PHYSODRAFT_327166 [Phytophthora sojae]
MRPCDIWKELEVMYGGGDAGGLKKARNEINRKMSTLVGKEMVTEHCLCMEVLGQLPSMFCERSITMTEEWFTRRSVVINVAKKVTGKKRMQDQAEAPSSGCYDCFEDGHRKKECPVIAKDRDPERAGGSLFRSNISTAPSSKKKQVITIKKGKKPEAAEDKLKKAIEETDQYEFKEPLPVSDGDKEEKPFTQMDIDNEGQELL